MVMHAIAATAVANAAAATAAPTTKPTTAKPVFWRDEAVAFTPRRGFEAALLAALGDDQLNADEVCRRMVDNGSYAKVAPQALALRPLKPINFLLKTWAAAGYLRRSN